MTDPTDAQLRCSYHRLHRASWGSYAATLLDPIRRAILVADALREARRAPVALARDPLPLALDLKRRASGERDSDYS